MDELSGVYYFRGKEEGGKVCGKGKEMKEMQQWTDGQFIIFIGNEAEGCKKIIKIVLIHSEAYKLSGKGKRNKNERNTEMNGWTIYYFFRKWSRKVKESH